MSFLSFSTGTKLASKTQKNSKSARFRLSTGTKSSKTVQKNFSKSHQDVFSTCYTNLRNKKKFQGW